jgi:hypothetical protein
LPQTESPPNLSGVSVGVRYKEGSKDSETQRVLGGFSHNHNGRESEEQKSFDL